MRELVSGQGAVTSPPYANRVDDHGVDQAGYEGQSEKLGRYGQSDGQIGNMRIAGVTSPHSNIQVEQRYSSSADNLGNAAPETYWQAVAQVYQQLYDLFSPGSHAAIVVKAFVMKGKIVPLPQMTLDLLLDIGFTPVTWIDAMLTGATQASMMDEVPDYTKSRKSFFRRLHEKKNPGTEINEEVVLVVRK